jgi:class 3 adenylate cyclase
MLAPMTCPACGASTPEGARFCPSCGQQLATLGDERRVVTVLFADLVGFTGLAEARDPESVKHLVDRCFEHLVTDIKSFGGQVDKIVGDAIVALFGAPVAHEDDPERAVRAALRMQQTLSDQAADLDAPVRMRIGINTGEVLVGALRAGGDYTAMGDVVNTASRLQTMAEPGEVLVGPGTHAATNEIIGYQPVGHVEVRGRGGSIEAWRAITALAPPGYRRRRTRAPLIGRDAELGLTGQAIDTATDRRRASVITLLGEAGVGKSRLAREVASLAAQRHGARVLEGRCVPYGEANVWWPIAEAVRHVFGVASDDAPEIVRELVGSKVAAAAGLPVDDMEVNRIVNGMLHLLGADSPLREIDPQRAREEMLRSVGLFLGAMLEHQPVMLVLSDVHWAGQPVFELLGALLERLADTPFIVMATARPPFRDSWVPGGARHNTLVVNVDPLSREATGALLDALLDGRIDAELRDVLLDRSGGNPFFLEELVALVDGGSLEQIARSVAANGGLPDTLRGLVAARLDALTRNERRALDDAAVYGREGPVEALVLMAKADRAGLGVRDEHQVRQAVQGLVDKEILVLDETGHNYSFRSDLVREVAYNILTKAARALRHWGIGQYLETNFADHGAVISSVVDGLAHHYGQAAEQVKDLGGVAGTRPTSPTERSRGSPRRRVGPRPTTPTSSPSASSARPSTCPRRARPPSGCRCCSDGPAPEPRCVTSSLPEPTPTWPSTLPNSSKTARPVPGRSSSGAPSKSGRATGPRRSPRSPRPSTSSPRRATVMAWPRRCACGAWPSCSAVTPTAPTARSPMRSTCSARSTTSEARRGRSRTWRGSRSSRAGRSRRIAASPSRLRCSTRSATAAGWGGRSASRRGSGSTRVTGTRPRSWVS